MLLLEETQKFKTTVLLLMFIMSGLATLTIHGGWENYDH
jgi:hypothetical protein